MMLVVLLGVTMSAVSLAGLLPEFGKLTPAVAAQWVAAAVAEAGVLRAYDGWLYPTDPARQPAAERLHEAWRSWKDDAQALLQLAGSLAAAGNEIPDLDALGELVAHARALLRLTPALIIHRYQQVQRGDVYPMEEVRRELRSGDRG
jgi:hypothetical protein